MQEQAFGHMLRTLREQRDATQAEVAAAVDVSRATIAQWEGGRHLPSPHRVQALDSFLGAGGALVGVAEREREGGVHPGDTYGRPAGLSLLAIMRRVETALLDHLQRDEAGTPLGWCQDLQRMSSVTPISTAFGVKLALLVGDELLGVLGPLSSALRSMRGSQAGWAASSQLVPRPEAIAPVLDALVHLDPETDRDEAVGLVADSLDDVARQRPAILSTALETVIDLRPHSALAREMLEALLASRRPFEGVLLWMEKNEDELVSPAPSVLHTARAVSALARTRSFGAVPPDLTDAVAEALDLAVPWLSEQSKFENLVEIVSRRTRDRNEVLYLRHYTPAWVARSLILAGVAPSHPTVAQAVREVRDDFDADHGLWVWRNGDLPIWMTLDAIAALRLAAFASYTP